jgi:hypothetical protein
MRCQDAGKEKLNEDLSSKDPGNRTPRGSEECDVKADECNQDTLGRQVDRSIGGGLANGNTDNCDNVLAETHTGCSNEHQTTTANSVNELDADDRHAGVHNVGDDTVA